MTCSVSRCRAFLGTYVEISLSGDVLDNDLHFLCDRAFAVIENIHALMSFHETNSELNKLNRLKPGNHIYLSKDIITVLECAQSMYTSSDGVFDIGIASTLVELNALPNHPFNYSCHQGSCADLEIDANSLSVKKINPVTIDLGGIAKGYAVDKAFDFLSHQPNIHSVVVNAGGDIRMYPFVDQNICIRPSLYSKSIKPNITPMLDQACATSANSDDGKEIESSIINPFNKESVKDARSITVFAPCCMHADALTKICFLTDDSYKLNSILESYKAQYLYV